jgi:hypothetical protein
MTGPTIVVQEVTGATATFQTVTNRSRLFTIDQFTAQDTPQLDHPVPIPTSGFHYSYWRTICLDISGTFTQVTNIRHYASGACGWTFGSGGQLRRGNRDANDIGVGVDTANGHTNNYQQAGGVGSGHGEGTSGDEIEATTPNGGHTFYNAQTTPVTDLTLDGSGSPPVVDSTSITAAGKSKAIVIQVKVDTATNGAASGIQSYPSGYTLTWEYDVIN